MTISYLEEIIAHYKLNENAASTTIDDEITAGLDGDLNVNTDQRSIAGGKVGRAIDFTTSGDNIDLHADTAWTDIWDGGGSVVAWVYLDSYGHDQVYSRIIDKSKWAVHAVGSTAQRVEFTYLFDGDDGTWKCDAETLGTGAWHMVVVTYDASSASNDPKIYVDNVEMNVTETATPTGSRNSDEGFDMLIGNRAELDRTFDGAIDEVRFYGKILNESEIAALWNDGDGTDQGILNTELDDIDNDFRTQKTWAADDIDNDFRMVGTYSLNDITNDFRITGAALDDITNDFRMIEEVGTEVISDISNDFRIVSDTTYDIDNKFNMVALVTSDIDNDFRFVTVETDDIYNDFRTVTGVTSDIDNDFRTKAESTNNITNDFRMIYSWQKPAGTLFESSGYSNIHLYIDDVEQTDVDIQSIDISQVLDGPHTCNFDLARAYDGTVPTRESVVTVKYRDILIYKGYITETNPTDDKEKIQINCQDKYWYDNKTKKYFFVGQEPTDNDETYYTTISSALSALSFTGTGIGSFTPQTMNLFGQGTSECVTQLINNSGNYHWFWDKSTTRKLWKAGSGALVKIGAQSIGTNINIYQVLKHDISISVDGIVNKLRVQMGDKITKRFNDSGGYKTYTGYRLRSYSGWLNPAWESGYERLSSQTTNQYGFDYPSPWQSYKYNGVFTHYTLPTLDDEVDEWTDRHPPEVRVYGNPGSYNDIFGLPFYDAVSRFSGGYRRLIEGYSIDYNSGLVTFNRPMYWYKLNKYYEITAIRRPNIFVSLWKQQAYSYTESTDEDPEADESNPLMFFTSKIGDYADTVYGTLELPGLSVQIGGAYYDSNGDYITVPSWDDTDFATDFANWQVSKTADEVESGTIELTIDALVYYNIDLTKQIYIDGVTSQNLDIMSISYDFNNFTATLNLRNNREFKRTVSLPSRGV